MASTTRYPPSCLMLSSRMSGIVGRRISLSYCAERPQVMIAGDGIAEDRKEGDRDDGNNAMRMQVPLDRRNLMVAVAAIGLLGIPAVAVALLPQLSTQETEATF